MSADVIIGVDVERVYMLSSTLSLIAAWDAFSKLRATVNRVLYSSVGK